MNIRVIICVYESRLKNFDFILIRYNWSEISNNDHSTGIPSQYSGAIIQFVDLGNITCSHDYAILGQIIIVVN